MKNVVSGATPPHNLAAWDPPYPYPQSRKTEAIRAGKPYKFTKNLELTIDIYAKSFIM